VLGLHVADLEGIADADAAMDGRRAIKSLVQVDTAYREKYGRRYASIVETISDPEHRPTTLVLRPSREA
jgi:hypothetical protein